MFNYYIYSIDQNTLLFTGYGHIFYHLHVSVFEPYLYSASFYVISNFVHLPIIITVTSSLLPTAMLLHLDEPRDWSDQSLIDYIADNVEVHVEVISNLEKTEDYYIPLELKLHNRGDRDIPRGTWQLYFYRFV